MSHLRRELVLLLIGLVPLSGSAAVIGQTPETLDRAEDAVARARAKAEQDPFRPVCHFRPAGQWMNDICAAFFHQGWHHVFFQFNPWSERWGKGVGWGHARSKDLVAWEILPPALLPDEVNGSQLDGSGSAAFDDRGRPILFYTHTPIGYPKLKRQQWAAIPQDDDLLRWQRLDIGLAPGKSGIPETIAAGWADMFVFRVAGRTFATFKASQGLVCEAQHPSLRVWKAVGRIPEIEGECPNLFPLGKQFALIRSTMPISYMLGDFDAAQIAFHPQDAGPRVLDFGPGKAISKKDRGLYGTSVFLDQKGRPVLLGWISGFPEGRGWNGCMSFPRVLQVQERRLIQEPLPELTALRDRHVSLRNILLDASPRVIPELAGGCFEIKIEFRAGMAGNFGVRLVGKDDKRSSIVLGCDGRNWEIAGTEAPAKRNADGRYRLHVFFDKAIVEAFLNDGEATVTRHVASSSSEFTLELFAQDGKVEVVSFDAWTLKPIWQKLADKN